MYSDSISKQSAFGAYVSNFGDLSGVYERKLTGVVNFAGPAGSPDTFNTMFGSDLTVTKPTQLLRRVEIYLEVAIGKSSSPTSIEMLIKSKF